MNSGPPTLAGFTDFLYNFVGIPPSVLPNDSPYIGMAFNVACNLTNKDIACVDSLLYSIAVYNLGADNIFNYAQDVPDAPPYKTLKNGESLPYFAYYRAFWNLLGFVSGVIDSASDESTSSHLVVQEAAQTFTLSNLQSLKTPYGRRYLSIAQDSGTLWGLTP